MSAYLCCLSTDKYYKLSTLPVLNIHQEIQVRTSLVCQFMQEIFSNFGKHLGNTLRDIISEKICFQLSVIYSLCLIILAASCGCRQIAEPHYLCVSSLLCFDILLLLFVSLRTTNWYQSQTQQYHISNRSSHRDEFNAAKITSIVVLKHCQNLLEFCCQNSGRAYFLQFFILKKKLAFSYGR